MTITIKPKRQRARVGVAGSFFNQLMANNESIPVEGKGATELHYTDRTCYEVIEVSEDGKTARLERLEAEWDKTKEGGCGHQNWILKPTGQFITVVWRFSSWYQKYKAVKFTKAFEAKNLAEVSFARILTDEQRLAVYGGEVRPKNVVEGITELRTEYSKIKLLFGEKDYYYDWSF